MSSTIFFRLLTSDETSYVLGAAIDDLRNSILTNAITHEADPQNFFQVPGTPFAYWVDGTVLRLFANLPSFNDNGRSARIGASTKNDFRFVRLWWEVNPSRVPDPSNYSRQESDDTVFALWVRQQTCESKRWVPFAKGGPYSPYYSDLHLVLDWANDGKCLKDTLSDYREQRGWGPQWSAELKGHSHYFIPGLTWSARSQKGLSLRTLPAGCIFGAKGPAVFALSTDLLALLALTNSAPFLHFVSLQVAFGSYEAGVIQNTPVPIANREEWDRIGKLSSNCVVLKRGLDVNDETSHVFRLPGLLQVSGASLANRLSKWMETVRSVEQSVASNQRSVDSIAFSLYGISDMDRLAIDESLQIGGAALAPAEEQVEAREASDEQEVPAVAEDARALVADLLSHALGCAYGRWDVRIAQDEVLAPELQDPLAPLPVCSPGVLVGPEGLPATPDNLVSEEWLRARPNAITLPSQGAVQQPAIPDARYPLRVTWDGIQVDDPEHPEDLVRRVREVLAVLWRDQMEAIEVESCAILGVRDLRDYLQRPSGFFADHLKRYSRSRRQAPIYWPLSSASGSYTLWIYYHRLTSDTLYTAVNRFVEPKMAEVQRDLGELERRLQGVTGREAGRLRDRNEGARGFLAELGEFRQELLRVAALPYRPNLDDGVIINAAPLHKLFRLPRWAKDTRECWAKLERGDYDWAHLARVVWPERVREKCYTDRSLAVAHDLEDLYATPPAAPGKGRRRGAAAIALAGEDGQ